MHDGRMGFHGKKIRNGITEICAVFRRAGFRKFSPREKTRRKVSEAAPLLPYRFKWDSRNETVWRIFSSFRIRSRTSRWAWSTVP